MFKTKKLFLIGFLSLALILPLAADEGMWLFNLFEVVKLADSLAQLKEELGQAPEVKWILAGRDPETAAKDLVSGTKLKDMEVRKKYLVPLNFVSTADLIGGNSGSPVVNRNGEVVGVLFDGNIQSLPTRFVYEQEISRSVMVHNQGIIEALRQIYQAQPLVEEILGQK